MTTPHIPTLQLLGELRTLFPAMDVRPLTEWHDKKTYPNLTEGLWITGCSDEMPDGEPMFIVPDGTNNHGNDAPHSGGIHTGFEQWLSLRGYYVEVYDYGLYWLVPIAGKEVSA